VGSEQPGSKGCSEGMASVARVREQERQQEWELGRLRGALQLRSPETAWGQG
jgi:hypothetical protein